MDIVKGIVSILLMIPMVGGVIGLVKDNEVARYMLVMLLVIVAFVIGASYWFGAPIWDF